MMACCSRRACRGELAGFTQQSRLLSMHENPAVCFMAPRVLTSRSVSPSEVQSTPCVGRACVSQAGELLVAVRLQ